MLEEDYKINIQKQKNLLKMLILLKLDQVKQQD